MRKQNTQIIVGVDECGRGPLAGPVVAAAITGPALLSLRFDFKVGDSKKMTARQREAVYFALQKHPRVVWGIGRVGEKVIDKINIFEASKLAMIRAVKNLENKLGETADLLLIDGNFSINLPHQQKSIIKGDALVPIISLASIIAKVNRDNLMVEKHKIYPQYGFDFHKGYPTKQHRAVLAKRGPCPIHRKTFGPVLKLLQN